MKKNKSLTSFYLLSLTFIYLGLSCSDSPIESESNYPPDNEYKVTISQGVWGNVWFWEGDYEPPFDPNRGKITPVVREIYIYKATPDSMVESLNSDIFFTEINSIYITKTRSDNEGFFQVNLTPDKYSFFVKEGALYYANEWDGEGHILPAVVLESEVTKRQIDITYKAVY